MAVTFDSLVWYHWEYSNELAQLMNVGMKNDQLLTEGNVHEDYLSRQVDS